MKKSVKDQTARAFQVGGYNPPSIPQQPYTQPTQVDPRTGTYVLPGTGIAGYQIPTGAPTGFTPYGGATPYFQPVQFTGAQYQTALQTTNLPTFAETVGQRAGQYDELRTYINDAGQTLQIPFKDGRPIYPIPEGYRPIGDQPAPEEEQTTVTPTLGETTVRDEGGGDRDAGVSGTGYQGLSTTRGTGTGGLSAAAAKAQSDLGLTGFGGIPGGGIVGGLANAFGFDVPTAFGKEPTQGMTGTLSQGQLEAIARGAYTDPTNFGALSPEDIPGLSTQQALNVMGYQQNYGVTLNGIIGYQNGNVSPNTGTPVRNGMTVDSAFGPNKTAEYASFKDMMDTISRGNKSGWRGGVVSEDTYNGMTPEQQSRYRDFDPEMAKEFDNRAMGLDDSPDPGTGRTGPESAAGAGEYQGGPTGFEGGQAPGPSDFGLDSPSDVEGPTAAESMAGAGDYSGPENGGHTGGSAADGSEAETGGGYGGLGH